MTEYEPGTRLVNTFVFDNVSSPSSSSEKGPPRPLVVKPKSRAAFGTASFTIVIVPRLALVTVQTIESPAATTKPCAPGTNGGWVPLTHVRDDWSQPALSPDSPTWYVPVATVFVPVVPGAMPVTRVELADGPVMSRVACGELPGAPPTHTLSRRSVPVARVLVIVHTTLSPAATAKFVGPNDGPVPLRTHDASVWVQPAVRPVSVAEYVPVATASSPVVPATGPTTGVVDDVGPVMCRLVAGVSPASAPLHTLFTRTVPWSRVLVIVQTTLSPAATAKFVGPNDGPVPLRTHDASVWVQPAVRSVSVAEYVPVATAWSPVVPATGPTTGVVDDVGPAMCRLVAGVSPASAPLHVLFTRTVPAWRVFVTEQTTLSPACTAKSFGSNASPVPLRTHDNAPALQPAVKPDSVAEYVPVTTDFVPVVPAARPVTGVDDADGPTMFKSTPGVSPATPPTHVLFTVTVPV